MVFKSFNKALGAELKDLRLLNKMTQKQIAKKVKCTGQFIYSIESGKTSPPMKMLSKMLTIYSGRTDYFTELILAHISKELRL